VAVRLRSAEWLAACLYVGQSTDWILERDGCRSDLLHAANTRERLMFNVRERLENLQAFRP